MADIRKTYKEKVEKFLQKYFESIKKDGDTKKLAEAMEYSVMNGGKRIRAFLVMAFCAAVTGNTNSDTAVPYAAAIEMVHAASLIHDDLPAMDNDDFRRGKPSCHIQFGEDTAIVAADSLFVDSFDVITSNKKATEKQNCLAVSALSRFSGVRGMCGGQEIDLLSTGNVVDEATLEKLQLLKTSGLITSACVMGVVAGNGDAKLIKAAEEYGKYFGLAFQTRDDILDVISSNEKMGKTVHKDLEEGKNTAFSIYGLDGAMALCNEYTEKAVKAVKKFGDNEGASALLTLAKNMAIREN